ncbi:MAG: bifunctional (p)ppGpp synthetase/guanosine-3',5'-bis(diphosphate) 3'-pyrophosphohydrolase [Armatimonadetes bacterium]|nr:bifunctional (p)ppGpp synthetase/guanosine-3',5'-bis(diphosphate) 3'-pyrophosphohydrolase [Armatimonadota bacterium]
MSVEPAFSDQIESGKKQLLGMYQRHWPGADGQRIADALELAIKAHAPQVRKSGEPYILHPIAVAHIVAELGMDEDSIVSALLHDVLEDTDVPAEKIEKEFGPEVLQMIEGVTKLKLNILPSADSKAKAAAETTRAAESLRKLLLAMANDFRVMVIKLADRLHNMRTLNALPDFKQTRIANETLEVYAPIAARLGIWQIKWQLEDLSFAILHPHEFEEIKKKVDETRADREKELQESLLTLQERLEDRGLKGAKVTGRQKHYYSIFNKHVRQHVPFDEIYDLVAIRVIVEEEFECYLALGIVYELWKPMPGLFTDHIQNPKPNGYQSLHTKVSGASGEPLEVQIRTREMHEIAEFGVAAHWTYKEGTRAGQLQNATSRFADLRRQLFEWSSDNTSSSDFLRSVSTDLFEEQVFCFTPKGDVLDLPSGATTVDFAFRVHSKVGERLVGAKINDQMVPLSTEIQNGDVVELITRKNATPSLDWLEFAKSAHTRSKLRSYFRKRNRDDIVQRGKDLVEKELRANGMDPRQFQGEEVMKEVVPLIRDCDAIDDIYVRVGEGLTGVQYVVDKIRSVVNKGSGKEERTLKTQAPTESTLVTSGIDNVMVKRARCCQPVPDEEVTGYVTRGRGIMLHRRLCPNVQRLKIDDPERITAVEWRADGSAYPVELKIVTINRQGLLMDITTIFGESKTNVVGAKIKTLPNHTAEIDISIEVTSAEHLRNLMQKIANYSDVISVLRVFGRVTPPQKKK